MLRDADPILLPRHTMIDFDDIDGVDCDQTAADVVRIPIPFKCEVVRAQVAVTEACAGDTTTPVVDFDLRPTIGSDTDRGAADIGHLVLSTTAAGKIMYDLVAVGTVLEVGQEVIVQLTVAATGTSKAGHFIPELLVARIPETLANQSDYVATA